MEPSFRETALRKVNRRGTGCCSVKFVEGAKLEKIKLRIGLVLDVPGLELPTRNEHVGSQNVFQEDCRREVEQS
jgi:hypothetical protein